MSKPRRNAHDGPVDLASLDPTRRASFDHLVEAIMADVVLGAGGSATPVRAIERARHERIVTAQIVRWGRPALVAAALVFVAAVPAFVLVGAPPPAPGTAGAATARFSVADAIGIPRPFADWAGSAGSPSVAEIVAAGEAAAAASSGPHPRARQGDSTSPTSRFHRAAP